MIVISELEAAALGLHGAAVVAMVRDACASPCAYDAKTSVIGRDVAVNLSGAKIAERLKAPAQAEDFQRVIDSLVSARILTEHAVGRGTFYSIDAMVLGEEMARVMVHGRAETEESPPTVDGQEMPPPSIMVGTKRLVTDALLRALNLPVYVYKSSPKTVERLEAMADTLIAANLTTASDVTTFVQYCRKNWIGERFGIWSLERMIVDYVIQQGRKSGVSDTIRGRLTETE